jgi:hypothetical protein
MKQDRPTWLLFLAITALIGGGVMLISLPYNGFFGDRSTDVLVSVILLAGGATYLMKTR